MRFDLTESPFAMFLGVLLLGLIVDVMGLKMLTSGNGRSNVQTLLNAVGVKSFSLTFWTDFIDVIAPLCRLWWWSYTACTRR